MKLVFEVKRSPARMSWWVCCNGKCIETRDTRREANELKEELERKYRR